MKGGKERGGHQEKQGQQEEGKMDSREVHGEGRDGVAASQKEIFFCQFLFANRLLQPIFGRDVACEPSQIRRHQDRIQKADSPKCLPLPISQAGIAHSRCPDEPQVETGCLLKGALCVTTTNLRRYCMLSPFHYMFLWFAQPACCFGCGFCPFLKCFCLA